MRLNKFLAICGIASRRKSEEYITGGRIKVNGTKVTKLGNIVNPEIDVVELDNKRLNPVKKFHYIMLHKPKGYITTTSDEKNRPMIMNIVPDKYKRDGVFPVGRLDKDSEGLLLLTNDGDLANKLTNPKFKFQKEYFVEIDKPLSDHDKIKIERGIFIHQIKVKTRPVKITTLNKDQTYIKILLTEGKKRQIRYSMQKFGYKVKKLVRTAYGPLQLKGVNRGSHRTLKEKEVRQLKDIIDKK